MTHTALWLILRAQRVRKDPPLLDKPDVKLDLLVGDYVLPTRMRKGKSGEIARTRGRKG